MNAHTNTTNHPPAIAAWHAIVQQRDPRALRELLSDEVVFYSPVVHTPQTGKAITALYLSAAVQVFGNESFRYVRELIGAHDAMLEFELMLGGIAINGIDLISWNADQKITSFKVMLRPLKAVQIIHQKMGEMLQQLKP